METLRETRLWLDRADQAGDDDQTRIAALDMAIHALRKATARLRDGAENVRSCI